MTGSPFPSSLYSCLCLSRDTAPPFLGSTMGSVRVLRRRERGWKDWNQDRWPAAAWEGQFQSPAGERAVFCFFLWCPV